MIRERIEQLHEQLKNTKQHLVDHHNGESFEPTFGILHTGRPDGSWWVPAVFEAGCFLRAYLGGDQPTRETVISTFIKQMHYDNDDDKLLAVAFGAEAYWADEDNFDADQYEEGDLYDDFRNNPDSKVMRSIATTYMEVDAVGQPEWGTMVSTFRLGDANTIEWVDDFYVDAEDGDCPLPWAFEAFSFVVNQQGDD